MPRHDPRRPSNGARAKDDGPDRHNNRKSFEVDICDFPQPNHSPE